MTVNAISDWACKCFMTLSLVYLSVNLFNKIILTSFTKQPYLILMTDKIEMRVQNLSPRIIHTHYFITVGSIVLKVSHVVISGYQ